MGYVREQTCTHADLFCCGSAHGALIYPGDLSLDGKLVEGFNAIYLAWNKPLQYQAKNNK